jgi:hypothetical protein
VGRAVIALLGKRERLRQGIPRAGKVRFSMEIKPPQVLVPASGCTVRNRVRGTSHSKSRTQGWIGYIERGHDSDVVVLRRHAGKTSSELDWVACPIIVNPSSETLIDEQR